MNDQQYSIDWILVLIWGSILGFGGYFFIDMIAQEAYIRAPEIVVHCPFYYHQEAHQLNGDKHVWCIKNISGRTY